MWFRKKLAEPEQPEEVRALVRDVPPTTLMTGASIRKQLVPPMPERYHGTATECALNGFFGGLDDVGFDLMVMSLVTNIRQKMPSEEYLVPEVIWAQINELSTEKIAKVIYTMVRFVHVGRALEGSERPAYLRLPLELAGEENFLAILDSLKPLLTRWGLDKGKTSANGLEYPAVIRLFAEERARIFRAHRLDDYLVLGDFILKAPLDYWPDELAEPFRESGALLLEAMRGVGAHYASEMLHPELRHK